ncbi:MAG: substrate-binding domain-containing protein [Nocardioides sp.]
MVRYRAAHPWFVGRRGLAIAVVLATAGGALLSRQLLPGTGDEAGAQVCLTKPATLATSANLAIPLIKALGERGCPRIDVTAVTPIDQLEAIKAGEDAPDYWIPDNTLWLDRLAAETDTRPDVAVASVAETPIVMASATGTPTRWSKAVAAPGYVLGEPTRDTHAFASIALATAGRPARRSVTILTPQALRAGRRADPAGQPAQIAAIAAAGRGVGAVSEQALLTSGTGLKAAVPKSGTLMMTFPLAETANAERRDQLENTTQLLTELVTTPRFHEALSESSFRVPGGASPRNGVGAVRVIRPPAAETARALLSTWRRMTRPIRMLTVVDVSGSMDLASAGGSRIDLTVRATRDELRSFPDTATVGLWAFSRRAGGNLGAGKNYRELARAGHPRVAIRELARLPELTGGDTALYATVIAAYRQARRTYDPAASNSVVLFCDGRNNDPGGPTLRATIRKLRTLADPRRPVTIIAIGISEDADARALDRLARATGGFSVIAERPEAVGTAFRTSIPTWFRTVAAPSTEPAGDRT